MKKARSAVAIGSAIGLFISSLFGALAMLATPAQTQYTLNPYAPTYVAAASWTLAVGSQTDVACIEGASTGTVRILKITMDGAAITATAYVNMVLRSSLNTGGTSSTQLPVARDSRNSAPTVNVRIWTAAPAALGVLVGLVDSRQVYFSTTVTIPAPTVFDFTASGQIMALNGANEALCINAPTVLNGGSLKMTVVFQQG
jgi:hypothetical protein